MTDNTAAIEAAIPAVLAEMDWPDDREFSAHVEPDGYQLTPPGAYWERATEIATAAVAAGAPLIVERAAAAKGERIARAIENAPVPPEHQNHPTSCVPCVMRQLVAERDAAIARRPETA